MIHIFEQSENNVIKVKPNFLLSIEKEPLLFVFLFFLKVEPIIPSRGRLIIIKKLLTSRGTDFSSNINLL